MTEPLLEAVNLTKELGSGAGKVAALKGVSLALNGGELTRAKTAGATAGYLPNSESPILIRGISRTISMAVASRVDAMANPLGYRESSVSPG